jgi:hypothetical protein
MEQKDLKLMSDDELLQEAKKMKSTEITNAFLIGFLIGIIIFSVAVSAWGISILIPLFLIYKFVNKPNQHKELKELLKERGLK